MRGRAEGSEFNSTGVKYRSDEERRIRYGRETKTDCLYLVQCLVRVKPHTPCFRVRK
jgi:hypothetical protein